MTITQRLFLLATFLTIAGTAQDKPDFSGSWTVDPLRSRFDKFDAPKSGTLRIAHYEPAFWIEMITTPTAGYANYTMQLKTDATESKQTIDGQTCVATAQWGTRTSKRLTIKTTCDGPDGTVATTRQLEMDNKGKMLTTILTIKDKTGERKAYEFFMRNPTS